MKVLVVLAGVLIAFVLPLGMLIGFFVWKKRVEVDRDALWSSAAESLGLTLRKVQPGAFRSDVYELDGEFEGHSLQVALDMQGTGEHARGYTVYSLKLPDQLRQQFQDDRIGGTISEVRGDSVVVENGALTLKCAGYVTSADDIVATARQLSRLAKTLSETTDGREATDQVTAT
jgi:hypothetical protein